MRVGSLRKILATGLCLLWGALLMADERTFGTGSLIIPMDSQTQNTEEDGIFLAYGVVYALLAQGLTVYVIINPDKTSNSDDPDLTLTSEESIEVVSDTSYVPVDPIPKSYFGGPFMVDATEAQIALNIISQSPQFASVVVHQTQTPVSAPVGETYDEVPKKIALLESLDSDGSSLTDSILVCYLRLAGLPAETYDILTADQVANGALTVGSYYILWIPHWVLNEQPDTALAQSAVEQIKIFADHGGNILALCKGIDSLEISDPLQTDHNLGINGMVTGETVYQHYDIPFSQIGDYPFSVDETEDTQSFRNWQEGDTPATGSSQTLASAWLTNVQLIAADTTPDNPWAYYTLRKKDSDPKKGNLHFIAGHQYASCRPTIVPGTVYRMSTTMSSCSKGGNKVAFWDNVDPCIRITLNYNSGDQEISIELCKGDYTHVVGSEFEIWTEDPDEDPDRFGTNYGPGCQGGGDPSGTDHLDGIFIRNLTTDSNIIIENITVEWSCNGFQLGAPGCADDYQFEQFDIKVDNGSCGTSSCTQCSDVTPSGKKECNSSGSFSFTPEAKNGSDLAFDGGTVLNEEGQPVPGNIGGLRYIYNTLLNNIINPVNLEEFARSGPVVDDGVAYFGTFEYPGNAGHLRAYQLEGDQGQLTEVWDAAFKVPAFTERNLFTFINGSKVEVSPAESDAQAILDYVADPTLTLQDMIQNIQLFRGIFRAKRLGGIERSTPAVVPPNNRSEVMKNRRGLVYAGSTYGVLEMFDMSTGVEIGGYVPAAILSRLDNAGNDDPNRPKVDSSPTVLDAFLLTDPQDPTGPREWRTILLVGHGSSAAGLSALDITDPSNISLKWAKFDSARYGLTYRSAVANYKKSYTFTDDNGNSKSAYTVGYAALVSSNLPSGNGVQLWAFDLNTGNSIWNQPFRINYSSPVAEQNDIPASIAIWDSDEDGFDDQLFMGDLAGRVWQIDLSTGTAKNDAALIDTLSGTEPSGEARPIAATPSIGFYEGTPILAIGTGGTDWSSATNNEVLIWDLLDNQNLFDPISIGSKKIYAPVVIAGDRIFFTAVEGSLNSPDPNLDLPSPDDPPSLLMVYSLKNGLSMAERKLSETSVTSSRSSVYLEDGQAFQGGFDGEIQRLGEKRDQQSVEALKLLIWKDLSNIPLPN